MAEIFDPRGNNAPQPQPFGDPIARAAASPTSATTGETYAEARETNNGGNVKVTGSAGADRINTNDLLRDSDHIIKTGDGNDIFLFREDANTKSELRNAVVDLGAGDKDQIVLANEISDYKITFRENGSIKFEYIGDGGTSNAAITFQGAEFVTFRNIADGKTDVDNDGADRGTFYASQTFTVEQLQKFIFDHDM